MRQRVCLINATINSIVVFVSRYVVIMRKDGLARLCWSDLPVVWVYIWAEYGAILYQIYPIGSNGMTLRMINDELDGDLKECFHFHEGYFDYGIQTSSSLIE